MLLKNLAKYTGPSVRCKRARHLCRFRGRWYRTSVANAGFKTKNGLGAESPWRWRGAGSRSTGGGPKRPRLVRLRHLGDHFFDDGLTKRVEVFRDHDEGARAAHHVATIIIGETARRIGVVGIPRHRVVAEDHEPVDGDAFGHRLVAQHGDVAAGIVGAVAGNVDGAARRLIGRLVELPHGE